MSADAASRVMELVRRGGTTAALVAASLGVSRPTAYKHLKALRKAFGARLVVRRERVAASGPKSRVYYMANDRRLKR